VIGDLAGYAASTLLRGLPLVQLPTTLIGQADSAIGGKTAINHHTGKNLIGAFHQPVFVAADLTTLQTLPDRDWTSGLAEVLKYAFIQDRELYDFLQTRWESVRERSEEAVREIVPRSVRVKADIVERDVHESGIRSYLNFGHTFAHALEKASGYGAFTHGEAVLLGMVAGLYLSDLHHADVPLSEGTELILRLPVPEPSEDLTFEELWKAMRRDKKVQDGTVRFVLIEELGTPELSGAVTREEAREAWTYVRNSLTERR
jgi:3-dehydroquinate synthase